MDVYNYVSDVNDLCTTFNYVDVSYPRQPFTDTIFDG